MKRFCLFLALAAATILAACSTFGQQSPQTPEDNLRYGQAIVTGIYKTVGDAAEQKSLTGAEARGYFVKAQSARKDLDSAEAIMAGIEPGGLSTAEAKIRTTLFVLQALSAELKTRLPAATTKSLPATK